MSVYLVHGPLERSDVITDFDLDCNSQQPHEPHFRRDVRCQASHRGNLEPSVKLNDCVEPRLAMLAGFVLGQNHGKVKHNFISV